MMCPQPPARAATPCRAATVGDRSRPADDDDAWRARRARFERDQRVVDDQHSRAWTDAPHDRADYARVVFAIDTGDAQADRSWTDVVSPSSAVSMT